MSVHQIVPCFFPADILRELSDQLDAKWRTFGTFLGVERAAMDSIETSNQRSTNDCMRELVSQWVSQLSGTGNCHRNWKTVVEAVRDSGLPMLANELAQKYGLGQ